MHAFQRYCALFAFAFAPLAQAILFDNGDGTVTDADTGLMWLKDANLACGLTATDIAEIIADVGSVAGHTLTTADFNVAGCGWMTWWGAMAWAKHLTYAGYSDWRLPATNPVNGSSYNYTGANDGSTDYNFNITAPGTIYQYSTGPELAHLWYDSLGNTAGVNTAGIVQPCESDTCLINQGPFIFTNVFVTTAVFWSGTEWGLNPSAFAWIFVGADGNQEATTKGPYGYYAWAVRPDTPSGNNVGVDLGGDAVAGGVTVTFSAVTTAGNTSLTIPSPCPSVPAGFQLGTSPLCYDLTTTAVYTPPIEVCINYSGSAISDPTLFHYEGGVPVDVTTTRDTANQIVCGDVNSLSPFVLAEAVGAPPAAAPPSIAKAFGAAAIQVFGGTKLTFTISNPNASALSGIGFTDTLPAGLIVATPNGRVGSCGGVVTATPASSSVALTGGTLVAGGNCNISVNVIGTTVGVKANTTGNVTSTEGGSGNVASANLTVQSPAQNRNCAGKLRSHLAKQFGGMAQAAAALGFASVRDLQQALRAVCSP